VKSEAEHKRKTMEQTMKKQENAKIVRDTTGYGDQVNVDKLRFSAEAPHEEAVLGILLLHPELGKETAGLLEPEDFATSFNRKLWNLFRGDLAEGAEPELNADGTLTPAEIGAVSGYRAARATLGSNDMETLRSHIGTLKEMRSKREYEGRIKEDPAVLQEYLALLRKNNQNKNSE
jgi:hypothetical protein